MRTMAWSLVLALAVGAPNGVLAQGKSKASHGKPASHAPARAHAAAAPRAHGQGQGRGKGEGHGKANPAGKARGKDQARGKAQPARAHGRPAAVIGAAGYVGKPRGNAPSFCRSGAGHPVYGRDWCVRKGFGLGGDAVWRGTVWDDVIFRRTDNPGTLTGSVLGDILGSVILNRLTNRATVYGYTEPLTGRWLTPYDGSRTLIVSSGRTPLVEMVDFTGDGRADYVLVNVTR